MKNWFYSLILFIIFTINGEAISQCAMCKSSVESNQKEVVEKAQMKAKGLNNGILYLMTIPYILIGTVGFLWYKNSRRLQS